VENRDYLKIGEKSGTTVEEARKLTGTVLPLAQELIRKTVSTHVC